MSKNWFLLFLVLGIILSLTACDVDDATQAVNIEAVQTVNAEYFAEVTRTFEEAEARQATATVGAIETKIIGNITRSFEATQTALPTATHTPTPTPWPTKTPTPTITPTALPTLQPRVFYEVQMESLPDWVNVEWLDLETMEISVVNSEYVVQVHVDNQIGQTLPLSTEFDQTTEFAVNILNTDGMWLDRVDYTGEVIEDYVDPVAKTYRTTAILEKGAIVEIVNYNIHEETGEKIHSVALFTVINDEVIFIEPNSFFWPSIWTNPWWTNHISLSVDVDRPGYCDAICNFDVVAIHATFDIQSMIAYTFGEFEVSHVEARVVYP